MRMREEMGEFNFFVNHAYLMTSEGYKKVLRDLYDCLTPRPMAEHQFMPFPEQMAMKNYEEMSSSRK